MFTLVFIGKCEIAHIVDVVSGTSVGAQREEG